MNYVSPFDTPGGRLQWSSLSACGGHLLSYLVHIVYFVIVFVFVLCCIFVM